MFSSRREDDEYLGGKSGKYCRRKAGEYCRGVDEGHCLGKDGKYRRGYLFLFWL